jgi:hypothetical protein
LLNNNDRREPKKSTNANQATKLGVVLVFNMKRASSSLGVEEMKVAAKAHFIQKLQRNPGYKRLAKIRGVNSHRLSVFVEFCWLNYCAAAEQEIRGIRAKRALRKLEGFISSIGDVSWLPDPYVGSLDALRSQLERLALKAKRGRPVDRIGRLLRRNMEKFVPFSGSFERTRRAASQEYIDEILTDVCAVVLGRRVEASSYNRMRRRDR